MAIQNTDPANITFKKTVSLSTVDANNNNSPIIEGFIANGPISQGVTPIMIAGGTKAVIPLSNTSGNGAPYLKIHFPKNPNGNKLYVTYCVANNLMADGYYDYKTGIPSSYYSALMAWINTNPSVGTAYYNLQPTVRTRTLKFSSYGNQTNKPANAVTFYVKFQATFQMTIQTTSGTLPSVSISAPSL